MPNTTAPNTPSTETATTSLTAPLAAQLPKYIDMAKWENAPETHITWQGEVAIKALPRLFVLQDSQSQKSPDQAEKLQVDIEFFQKNAVVWAKIRTHGTLWQTCQRCLEPVAVPLDYDNTLAILNDDSETQLIDEDTDFVLLDELPHDSSSDKKLLVSPFIEDELLVHLPLAPKHDDCEMAVTEVGEFEEDLQENPFAMLASLKGKLPS